MKTANLAAKLKEIDYFLLDMDGTVYLGDQVIGDMDKTLNTLRDLGKNIVFLTNNSSKSASAYVNKLKKIGLYDERDVVFTSGIATIEYLKTNHSGKSVYLVGTNELMLEFESQNINLTQDMPDIAVLSYDTTLTYQKLCKFTNYITKGATYIATHPDINCPAPDVYLPDIGSFMSLIKKSTGLSPQVICGKPYKFMGNSVLSRFGIKKSQVLMVGDRLSTDIKFAKNNGFSSLLVLSGETDLQMQQNNKIKADFILPSLNDILKFL